MVMVYGVVRVCVCVCVWMCAAYNMLYLNKIITY